MVWLNLLGEQLPLHAGKLMITEFDDYVTWMYVLIDDIRQQIGPLYERSNPDPECSNAELITIAIVGESRE